MKSTPIDLKAEFDDVYRIDSEETRQPGQHWDPWLAQIRCRYGHIYVHGGDELGVSVNSGRVGTAGTIRRMKCVRVVQDGDDGEVNAVFHRRHLDEVLDVMKPYRRVQLSEEERARRAELLVNARKLVCYRGNGGHTAREGRSGLNATKVSGLRETA